MHRIVNVLTSTASEVDLAGGWSWTVWLLIPLVLVLALLTARALGSADDPDEVATRAGGVSRVLARTDEAQGSPSATSTEGQSTEGQPIEEHR